MMQDEPNYVQFGADQAVYIALHLHSPDRIHKQAAQSTISVHHKDPNPVSLVYPATDI